jgi:EF hand
MPTLCSFAGIQFLRASPIETVATRGEIMWNKLRVVVILPALFITVAMLGNRILAQKDGGAVHVATNVGAGQPEVKQLLFLMDTDKNGKVSKQEFMNFMSQEFDSLDVNRDGVLDVQELTRPGARLQWVGK